MLVGPDEQEAWSSEDDDEEDEATQKLNDSGRCFAAVYAYEPEPGSDELGLSVDEVVHILEVGSNDWWFGVAGERSGWLPGTYLRPAPQLFRPPLKSRTGKPRSLKQRKKGKREGKAARLKRAFTSRRKQSSMEDEKHKALSFDEQLEALKQAGADSWARRGCRRGNRCQYGRHCQRKGGTSAPGVSMKT